MEDSSCLQEILKWTRDLADGTVGHEIEFLISRGIRVVKAHKGFLLCDFIVHKSLSDDNGNWHAGAIATLVDVIGSWTSHFFTSSSYHNGTVTGTQEKNMGTGIIPKNVTVDFSISYYSTAKVQEEVQVEAKVLRKKGDLTSVIVKVRKKENGELVALGKLWMGVARTRSHGGCQASKL